MMITADQLRAQYARNAEELEAMVAEAAVVTECGKGGPKGKRYNGYFYHQLVKMAADRRASANKTDAELAHTLLLLNRALGGDK